MNESAVFSTGEGTEKSLARPESLLVTRIDRPAFGRRTRHASQPHLNQCSLKLKLILKLNTTNLKTISLDPGSDYLGGVVPKDGLESGFLAGSL